VDVAAPRPPSIQWCARVSRPRTSTTLSSWRSYRTGTFSRLRAFYYRFGSRGFRWSRFPWWCQSSFIHCGERSRLLSSRSSVPALVHPLRREVRSVPVLVRPLRREVRNPIARYAWLTPLRGVNRAGVPALVHPLRREVPSAFFPLKCASPRSSIAERGRSVPVLVHPLRREVRNLIARRAWQTSLRGVNGIPHRKERMVVLIARSA
jgi:hypothetical protein